MQTKKNKLAKELLADNRLKSISLLLTPKEQETLQRFIEFYTPEVVLEELFQLHIQALAGDSNDFMDKKERSNQALLIKLLHDVTAILLKPINSQAIN